MPPSTVLRSEYSRRYVDDFVGGIARDGMLAASYNECLLLDMDGFARGVDGITPLVGCRLVYRVSSPLHR